MNTEAMIKERTISATKFKAKCLSLLDHLEPAGIIVTKRGHAIARVLPLNTSANEALIGSMKGKIKVNSRNRFIVSSESSSQNRNSQETALVYRVPQLLINLDSPTSTLTNSEN